VVSTDNDGKRAAEIGWFIIKYIEDHKIHSSVGVGKDIPQIWFIPNNEGDENGQKRDYQITPTKEPLIYKRMKRRITKMYNENEKHLKNLINI